MPPPPKRTVSPEPLRAGRKPDRKPTEAATRLPSGPQRVSGNLFDAARPGRPVVRPEDLLAIWVELVNLELVPGTPPRLRASGNDPAYLVLHYPPQAIAEEVFYETPSAGRSGPVLNDAANPLRGLIDEVDAPPPCGNKPKPSPQADRGVDPTPIRARAAGESRLAFCWPAGLECEYTVDGVLKAVQALDMKVPPAALPRQGRSTISLWPDIATINGSRIPSKALTSTRPLALAAFSLRQTAIARRGRPAAEATLMRRR